MFRFKLNTVEFGELTSLCLLSLFVMAEYWEIPIYVYGYLGAFENMYVQYVPFWWFIHHFYVIAVFVLFTRLSEFKFTTSNVFVLLFGSATGFFFMSPLGSTICYRHVVTRLVSFVCFTIFVGLGVQKFKPLFPRAIR